MSSLQEVANENSTALSITGGTNTTVRASHWSITINNPTEEDVDAWKNVRSHHFVKHSQGQFEKGENGTVHIQGYLQTDQVRFSSIKKIFPRAHIEVARNPVALLNYVSKEETRVATIENTRVASPLIVQTYLYDIVMGDLIQDDLPIEWEYKCFIEDRNPVRRWIPQRITWEAIGNDKQKLVDLNRTYIKKKADEYIDRAVESLIERGYYGLEFVISNNQVRNGYKKYLPSIIIRHGLASPPPPSPSPQDDSTPSSSDDP